ncbi:MAG TPA: hypothetical protein VH021_18930 [Trebonia sp.]|nr:hypothetical protein [Trebonia sp.]
MTRYLSGLCVAGLGLCGGGWLVVAAVAFGGESAGGARRVNLLTGAVLIAVCSLSLVCWSRAWRQRMRADGILVDRFPLVSRRDARRNRRARKRDVRRAAKLAERSARGARRAARRSARLASGGALSEGGVLAEGVASAGDEAYSAAASYGPGTNGSALRAAAANGTDPHGTDPHRKGAGDSGIGASDPNPGESAAELISELRSMLEPLLAATGSQPALAEQPSAVAVQPSPARQTAVAASPLPQRSPFASPLRPRATAAELAMPRPRSAPMSIPRLAPAVDDSSPGPASDGEDAWW